MHEIKRNIEQLEETVQQLNKRTPTGARLSLLLLDNLAELLMYKKVRLIFARDGHFNIVTPPKYSPKKRGKVTEYFDDKVNFIVSETQDISQDEGDVLKIGHQFRNEAYHKGVLRESIIICVTTIYFEIVCKLLPRLWTRRYGYHSQDEITVFLQRYGIQESMINAEVLVKICNNLLKERTCSVPELCEVLSEDLLRRIEETVDSLNDLSSNALQRTTADNLLKEMQFSQMDMSEDDSFKTDEEFREFMKAREERLLKYRPSVTMDRIESWKQRASALKSETKPGVAMRKFDNLDKDLLPIERMVEEAIFQFDEVINAQIHANNSEGRRSL